MAEEIETTEMMLESASAPSTSPKRDESLENRIANVRSLWGVQATQQRTQLEKATVQVQAYKAAADEAADNKSEEIMELKAEIGKLNATVTALRKGNKQHKAAEKELNERIAALQEANKHLRAEIAASKLSPATNEASLASKDQDNVGYMDDLHNKLDTSAAALKMTMVEKAQLEATIENLKEALAVQSQESTGQLNEMTERMEAAMKSLTQDKGASAARIRALEEEVSQLRTDASNAAPKLGGALPGQLTPEKHMAMRMAFKARTMELEAEVKTLTKAAAARELEDTKILGTTRGEIAVSVAHSAGEAPSDSSGKLGDGERAAFQTKVSRLETLVQSSHQRISQLETELKQARYSRVDDELISQLGALREGNMRLKAGIPNIEDELHHIEGIQDKHSILLSHIEKRLQGGYSQSPSADRVRLQKSLKVIQGFLLNLEVPMERILMQHRKSHGEPACAMHRLSPPLSPESIQAEHHVRTSESPVAEALNIVENMLDRCDHPEPVGILAQLDNTTHGAALRKCTSA